MIKCCVCGRFISYKDLESGKASSEEVYTYEPVPDLWDIVHLCVKCTEKEKK